MLGAELNHAGFGAPVEHGVLHLVRDYPDTGVEQLGEGGTIEVGRTQQPDFPLALELRKPAGRLEITGDRVIPPMELHQIESLDAQPPKRAVDYALDVPSGNPGELIPIRNELGVDVNPLGSFRTPALLIPIAKRS